MPPLRPSLSRSASPAVSRAEGVEVLLLPIGLMLAVTLPFFVVWTLSDDVHYEAKVFAQAAAAAIALAALFLASAPSPTSTSSGRAFPKLLTVSGLALLGAVLLSIVSAIRNHDVVDPLSALSFLAPASLFLAGASEGARRVAPRVLAVLAGVSAATGALAFGQRFLAVPRLPLEAPPLQPRFLATALVGNPGDMAAALVIPALLLWAWMLDASRSVRLRLLSAAGFLACTAGIGASQAVTAIVSVSAGMVLHALFAPRRRLLPLVGALLAGAIVLGATGAGSRVVEKLREAGSGRIGAALTQRDIGLVAAAEMVRAAPALGVGPGCFDNSYARAHLAAEQRNRRRSIHLSSSSHFENAHCEPLTLAAEDGLPAAFLALVSFGALAAALLRCRDGMRDLLGPPLLAFFILSLGSFPLRMPASAGVFALLCGLAWRCAGGDVPLPASPKPRRALLASLAALLLLVGGARLASSVWQARGEAALRQAALATSHKGDFLAEARSALWSSARLHPRSPGVWLALGSCERLDRNVDRAWDLTARSFSLEERAETDFNLGLLSFDEWDRVSAQALFVRAVWLLPRLQRELADEHAPGAVELDVLEAEGLLKSTGEIPPLPPKVDALRLTRRFP